MGWVIGIDLVEVDDTKQTSKAKPNRGVLLPSR